MNLIEQVLNKARAEQVSTLRSGQERLSALKSESVASKDREAQQQRLDSLTDQRTLNPRETANNFANLLQNDGGFGAAIGFGLASAQADFADLVDSRINDARGRLDQIRQAERDAASDQRISFDQESRIAGIDNKAAQIAVDGARNDLARFDSREDAQNRRADARDAREQAQDSADRTFDRQGQQQKQQQKNFEAQFEETKTNNQQNRDIRASELADKQLDRTIALSDRVLAVQAEIDGINPERTSEQKEIEKQLLGEVFSAFDNAGDVTIREGLFGASIQGKNRAFNAKVLVDKSKEFTDILTALTTENSKQVFADAFNGRIDPAISDLRGVIANLNPETQKDVIKEFQDRLFNISLLKARISDELQRDDRDAKLLSNLRDRESLLNTALQATKARADRVNGND